MSLFKDMLKGGETVFRDTIVLGYDFQPKVMKYRENEQMRFAVAVRPLLQGHNGRNLFVYGAPGIGKTTACKHVMRELGEETEEVVPIYVNCWKENTTFKIFYKMCEELGFKFLVNKKTMELFDLIRGKLNKKSAVIIFDEIDKLEDYDFLYTLLEDIYRKSIFLITNYRESYNEMDERIRSRLNPEFLFFRSYNKEEVRGILEQRKEYGFVLGAWDEEAFSKIVEKCFSVKDLRVGLYLMKESGNLTEERSLRKIGMNQVNDAIRKADEFQIKSKEGLDEDLILILDIIKDNSGEKIGSLYENYKVKGGEISYKTFTRKVDKLKEGRFISTKKVTDGGGLTTLISYGSEKKLTEF